MALLLKTGGLSPLPCCITARMKAQNLRWEFYSSSLLSLAVVVPIINLCSCRLRWLRRGRSRGRAYSRLRVVGGHRPPGWQGQDESEALCVERRAASRVTCQDLMQFCLWPKRWGSVDHPQPPMANLLQGEKEVFL